MADMPRRVDITFWPETGEVSAHAHRTLDGSDSPSPLDVDEDHEPGLTDAIKDIINPPDTDAAPAQGWPAWAAQHLGGQSAVGDPHPMIQYLRSRATRADTVGGGAYVVYLSDAERAITNTATPDWHDRTAQEND